MVSSATQWEAVQKMEPELPETHSKRTTGKSHVSSK